MRRLEYYKVKRNDNLAAAAFWNERFEDIDLRLASRENDAEAIDAAIDLLLATGLQRLDDTFTPLIQEAEQALSTYGVSFSALSSSEVTVDDGTQTFVLTAETRDAFYTAQYVAIVRASDPNISMLATVTSYTRATGTLVVSVVSHLGSGTYSDWAINLGAAPDTSHSGRTDNPHEVTAAQTGAYTIAQTDAAIDTAIGSLPPITTALLKANNLNDLDNKATARSNLGLGSLAVESEVGSGMFASSAFGSTSPVIIDGGTF